jgi:lysozyme
MVPAALLGLIRRFEGLRLKAYYCPAGVLTCGYGSTGPDIKPDTAWTKEQAEARMARDASVHATAAANLCPVIAATPDALAAIADFSYNLGATRLKGSTLRRKINAGDMAGARAELAKWVRGGGKVLPGLVVRRATEAALLK